PKIAQTPGARLRLAYPKGIPSTSPGLRRLRRYPGNPTIEPIYANGVVSGEPPLPPSPKLPKLQGRGFASPIPKGFRPLARGCAVRGATLGTPPSNPSTPTALCPASRRFRHPQNCPNSRGEASPRLSQRDSVH